MLKESLEKRVGIFQMTSPIKKWLFQIKDTYAEEYITRFVSSTVWLKKTYGEEP